MTDTAPPAAKPKRERWTPQWLELFDEVITTGLCTGCAACVISCPHDVIGYDHDQGGFKPFHLEVFRPIAPVVEVDGQDLFWWGVRTPAARRRLHAAIAAALTRP